MDGRICLVLLTAVTMVTMVSCDIGDNPTTSWIHYACKANGDISVRIPSALPYIRVLSMNGLCTPAYQPYVANETGVYLTEEDESSTYDGTQTAFILITNCAESLENGVTLELKKTTFTPNITGGSSTKVYSLGCNLEKNERLVELHVNTSISFATSYGYEESVADNEYISVTTRNLLGQEDFVTFTFAYPIFAEFTGPPSTTMIASRCVAYDINHKKEKVLVTNGCTHDDKLMTSFSPNVTDWTHRPGVEIKAEELLLGTEMGDTEMDEEPEEEEPERPWIWADIKAFRFRWNKEVQVECDFKVCPEGDSRCEMNCLTEQ